jgi:hypothetical protein
MQRRSIRRALVAATTLVILAAVGAYADTVPADGDAVTPGNQSLVVLPDTSPGQVVTWPINFRLTCDGLNHAAPGATIQVTATTPPANQNGNAAEWLMQTFTDTAGTANEQNDNPPVLIGVITTPTATITFVDGSGTPISNPVLQNNQPATVRVRITQSANNGIKYTDVAVPTCFSSPTGVTATVSAGGNAYDTPVLVTDQF